MKKLHSRTHYFLLFLVLAISFAVGSSMKLPLPLRRYHVRIQNHLNDKILYAHCKSSDDDLGAQTIEPDKVYEFDFKINYLGTTLFFCNLWYWENHVVFDAFRAEDEFVYNGCGGNFCNWKAQEDGVYLLNASKKQWNFKNNWDKKQV